MGTFDTLAKIIMDDIKTKQMEEEEAEELDWYDDDSVMIAHAQYEDDQLDRYLEVTSIMTDEDILLACWSAAADRCVSVYQTIFKKAMSQYE